MDMLNPCAGACPEDAGERKPPHESAPRLGSGEHRISRQHVVAMCGLYLVAAELARRGFIVSPPTSPAMGLLVMRRDAADVCLVSVSAKAGSDQSWRLDACRHAPQIAACIHVFVDIGTAGDGELFAVPGADMEALAALPECADGEVSESVLRRYGGGNAWQAFAVGS